MNCCYIPCPETIPVAKEKRVPPRPVYDPTYQPKPPPFLDRSDIPSAMVLAKEAYQMRIIKEQREWDEKYGQTVLPTNIAK